MTVGGAAVHAPADGRPATLNVWKAAYGVRLVDEPYVPPAQTADDGAEHKTDKEEGAPPPEMSAMQEAKMGDYTVSLVHCVATGKKVAADGSIVLAPVPVARDEASGVVLNRPTVMLSHGDVLLTDLRSQVIAQGMKARYSAHTGYQQLVVNGKIVVRRDQKTGKIDIEGPLCEDFYKVRAVVHSQYVIL
uniref:Cleavage and polyadenylation specificity factor subunit 2 n=1 Tax=Corethron hystrix TaxID=216773 RepID=A0A7S1FYW9_9STRA